MRFYTLILGVLCVWRITHLFNAEDGPWDLLVRIRNAARRTFRGELLDCFYCLSLWISVPFALALGTGWGERFLLWLAFSAGAILVERVTSPESVVPPAPYFEEEKPDALLRPEQD